MIDRRARLRPKDGGADYVYGDFGGTDPSILSILRSTNGMVWNYTPTISESRQVNYEFDQPVHTNAGYNNYKNSSNPVLNVQGTFMANTGAEAMYLLAVITFLRAVTLMDFGRLAGTSANPDMAVAGAPPPILLFSAYGRYMYNDIPVVVKNVSFTFPEDVHYVQVPVDSSMNQFNTKSTEIRNYFQNLRLNGVNMNKENEVFVPHKMTITLQLEEQVTADYVSKSFNLNAFKRGELLRRGGYI